MENEKVTELAANATAQCDRDWSLRGPHTMSAEVQQVFADAVEAHAYEYDSLSKIRLSSESEAKDICQRIMKDWGADGFRLGPYEFRPNDWRFYLMNSEGRCLTTSLLPKHCDWHTLRMMCNAIEQAAKKAREAAQESAVNSLANHFKRIIK